MDLDTTPAAAPPPGVVPNFVDPESRAHVTVSISAVMILLVFIFAGGRVVHNGFIMRSLKMDDCAFPPSFIFMPWRDAERLIGGPCRIDMCAIAVLITTSFTALIIQRESPRARRG
jgi:hypothetical protein